MAVLSLTTNICIGCKTEKPLDQFYRAKNRHGTIYAENYCKPCRSAQVQQTKQKAIADPKEADRRREWRKQHKRKLRQAQGCTPRETLRARAQAREQARLERLAQSNRKQHDAHVKRWRGVLAARAKYHRDAKDPAYILNTRMRVAIGKSLRSEKAGRGWEDLVGYTREELIRHLERQFTKGMTWELIGAWHIDQQPRASLHVGPCTTFNPCGHETTSSSSTGVWC